MSFYYARRTVEIIREEGFIKLSIETKRFLLYFPWKVYDTLRNGIKYDTVCEVKTYQLPVSELEYSIDGTGEIKESEGVDYVSAVLDGDWYKRKENIYAGIKYRSLHKRYCEDASWQETPYYDYISDDFESSRLHRKYPNAASPIEALEIYDDIYEDMRRNGFREESNLRGCIGPNGTYIISDGRHRLALAKILGIDTVPVEVYLRHKQWQELRDDVHNNGLCKSDEHLRDHPDLQDVLD